MSESIASIIQLREYMNREGLSPADLQGKAIPPGAEKAAAGLRSLLGATEKMAAPEAAAYLQAHLTGRQGSGEFPQDRSPGQDNDPGNEIRGTDLGR